MLSLFSFAVRVLTASLSIAAIASAQCTLQMQPGSKFHGVQGGEIRAMGQWDPDGGGPAPARFVFGGTFTTAGGAGANRIVAYDPVTRDWIPLGSGMNGPVVALCSLSNGRVIAAGAFSDAGGTPVNNIAEWDGTSWLPLGTGVDNDVYALATLPNGDIVAGGYFTTAGSIAVNRIARWDGTSWAPLGLGVNAEVRALTIWNGDLIAGGQFTVAGGNAISRLARWSGGIWSPVGVDGANDPVRAFATASNGDLIIGGDFTSVDGVLASRVARWSGSAWSRIGIDGVNDTVHALAVLPSGEIVVGGSLTSVDGVLATHLARWDGSTWSPFGGTNSLVYALTVSTTGNLLCGGAFVYVGVDGVRPEISASRIAMWNGTDWLSLGQGFNSPPRGFTTLSNGDVLAVGGFTTVDDVAVKAMARWNGSQWVPYGPGVLDAAVAALALGNGDLVVAGAFWISGSWTNCVLLLSGSSWTVLGGAFDNSISHMTQLANGDIVVAGTFTQANGTPAARIARWDGTSWTGLGTGLDNLAFSLLARPGGDLIVAGMFTSAGGALAQHCARWDGSSWFPMHISENAWALASSASGDLYIGTTLGVRMWSGTSWGPVGPSNLGWIFALATLPDGDVLAGALSAIAGLGDSLVRWDGASWTSFGGVTGGIERLWFDGSGRLFVNGSFTSVQGAPVAGLATWTSPCVPVASTFGSACASTGGPNTLAALTPPWVDATFRAQATGLPPVAIVLKLTSLTSFPQGLVPLTLAFPQAGPGCDVLVAPDILGVDVSLTGSVTSELFLPNVPPLVGVTFYHQLIPIELDALGAWSSVTATNALQLTAGQF